MVELFINLINRVEVRWMRVQEMQSSMVSGLRTISMIVGKSLTCVEPCWPRARKHVHVHARESQLDKDPALHDHEEY